MHLWISKQYLLLDSAEKIWNTTNYSHKGKNTQSFAIWSKIHATKIGELTITDYSDVSRLW